MRREHLEVLITMRDAGLLTRQAVKSVRGQLIGMDDNKREQYLKKIIKLCAPLSKTLMLSPD